MWFSCLQIVSVPSKRTNKLCTHAHHSDRSIAAIFANGTYFVDTPHELGTISCIWTQENGFVNCRNFGLIC
jgi:hypothetical protein